MKAHKFLNGEDSNDETKIKSILEGYFPEESITMERHEDGRAKLARVYSYSRRRPELEIKEPLVFGIKPSESILVSSPQQIKIPQMRGKVLIKPNLVHIGKYPETVSPDILEAVTEHALDMGSHVEIGDGPSLFFDAESSLERIRYMERKYGIYVLNMNSRKYCRVNVRNPLECHNIDIPSSLMDFDYLINVSQVKGHNEIAYSGVMKNIFGLLAEHDRLIAHRKGKESLKKTIVDVYNTLTPTFNIVDGRKLLVSCQQRAYGGYEIEGFGILTGSDGVELDREAFRQYSHRFAGIKEEDTYLTYVRR